MYGRHFQSGGAGGGWGFALPAHVHSIRRHSTWNGARCLGESVSHLSKQLYPCALLFRSLCSWLLLLLPQPGCPPLLKLRFVLSFWFQQLRSVSRWILL